MFMLTVNTLTKILFAVETSKKVPNLKRIASDCRESFGNILNSFIRHDKEY